MSFIAIFARPSGEAPEWVRDAWVGLTLPILVPEVVDGVTIEVLSGKLSDTKGYQVDPVVALMAMESKSPKAARWWRGNVPLNFVDAFSFDKSVCRLLL